MIIALSTDHAGFEQLKRLTDFLTHQGHECLNFGPANYDENDDFPDYVFPAAQAVAEGRAEFGIIMGGSGQGEAMAANRIKGVRCAVYYGPAHALGSVDNDGHPSNDLYDILRLTRFHNNANMLSIGARFVGQSGVEHVVTEWLNTNFSGEERHSRRIAKLDEGR